MREIAVITGAGSGIGRALTQQLIDDGYAVIAIGRRMETLTITQQKDTTNIHLMQVDLAKPKEIKSLENYLTTNNIKIKFLIHNAAVLEPIGNILEIDIDDFKYHLAINLEAPLVLTKLCLPYISTNGRILHISSGAAHHVIRGWGCYCVSKAALLALYNVLKNDLQKFNVIIGSIYPGIVDTPMQERIRNYDKKDFPELELFQSFKKNGKLLSPEKVASCLSYLLLNTTNAEFSDHDWDIKDILKKL